MTVRMPLQTKQLIIYYLKKGKTAMRKRQILLDTETTGIRVEDGHRIIEIGCIEMINRKLTGQSFHYYLNPEREVDKGAFAVHGISNEFLQDKPLFHTIAQRFVDFIIDAELIIHNAPFDLSFLNHELQLTKQGFKSVTDYCEVLDTLSLARQLHVGQRNSLDALCKRYGVDLSKRDLHGALLDANLLAQVYLAMTGGQGNFFDAVSEREMTATSEAAFVTPSTLEKLHTPLLSASPEEIDHHQRYLQAMQANGTCLWLHEDKG